MLDYGTIDNFIPARVRVQHFGYVTSDALLSGTDLDEPKSSMYFIGHFRTFFLKIIIMSNI